MFKKTIILVLVMVFAFSMVVLTEAKTVEVRFCGTITTAANYMLGVGWSNVLREYYPDITMKVLAGGGTTKLLRGVINKSWEIGFMGSPHLMCAKEGILLFEKEKEHSKERYYDPTRALFAIATEWQNFVVRDDSGIYSIDDLKGAQVHLGNPGGFGGIMTKAVLKTRGIDIDKGDYKGIYIPTSQAIDQLRDKTGLADAIVWGGIPQPLISELSYKVPLRLLSMPKETLEKFQKEHVLGPYTDIVTVTPEEIKEAYEGKVLNTEPCYFWTIPMMLIVHKDMDEEVVYNIVKTFWEHLDEVKTVSKQLEGVSLDKALTRLSIPLHPGALKYYKEIRAIK